MAGSVLKKLAAAGDELVRQFYSKTPRERLADASERATFDPEDGGLGLAPGNTSYERMQLMFPTRVFHGGGGKQAANELPRRLLGVDDSYMFVSDKGQVASSYAPAARRDPKDTDKPLVTQFLQGSNNSVPDFNGNVMPLRIDDSGAAVADFEGRLFSGFRDENTPDGIGLLNDLTVTSTDGTPLIRLRKEINNETDMRQSMAYLPHENLKQAGAGRLDIRDPFSTDHVHSMSGYAINNQYGNKSPMTRFDNIIDIGRHRHGEKSSERYIPSTVYAIRDGSKVRSDFAAFDPFLRYREGLSLGTSAVVVDALLDQMGPGESVEGALYER